MPTPTPMPPQATPAPATPATPATPGRFPVLVGVLLVGVAVATTLGWERWHDGVTDASVILVNGSATVLAALGARRRGGADRAFAVLLTGGLGLNVLGDLVWTWDATRRDVPAASPADASYLLSTAVLGAALFVVLSRGRDRRFDPDTAVDALTVAVVSGLVLLDLQWRWGVVDDDALAQVVLTAYPVLDAVALGLLLRLALDPTRRSRTGPWLVVGLGTWLTTDLLHLFDVLPDPDGALPNLG